VVEWEPAEQEIGYEFAEKGLLRFLVKEPGFYEVATAGLKASDFLDKRNSAIFTCIKQLRDLGIAISWESIETSLQAAGQLGLVGGRGYLMSVESEEGLHLANLELLRRLFRNSRGSIDTIRRRNETR
jgi:replicative DNA helicase